MAKELAQPKRNIAPVTIHNAEIIFRNFTGREGQYNAEGDRNFGVKLPPDIAKQMAEDGWNVKYLKSREEGEEPQAWLSVSVSYRNRPPRIVMVRFRGNPPQPIRTTLPEDLVEMVDYADLANVDLTLNPYVWGPIRGETGVKAYLKTMFVTLALDELEVKYANVEEVDINGAPLQISSEPHEQLEGEQILEGELIEDEEYS